MRVRDIKRACADELDVPLAVLDAWSRGPNHVRARLVCYHLSKTLTGKSTTVIGREMGGRDHSTVCSGLKRVRLNLAEFAPLIERVRARLDNTHAAR